MFRTTLASLVLMGLVGTPVSASADVSKQVVSCQSSFQFTENHLEDQKGPKIVLKGPNDSDSVGDGNLSFDAATDDSGRVSVNLFVKHVHVAAGAAGVSAEQSLVVKHSPANLRINKKKGTLGHLVSYVMVECSLVK